MDNQHRMIQGYRDLSRDEIDLVNAIKAKEAELDALVTKVKDLGGTPRWAAIAWTHYQEGTMALIRAITKPNDGA